MGEDGARRDWSTDEQKHRGQARPGAYSAARLDFSSLNSFDDKVLVRSSLFAAALVASLFAPAVQAQQNLVGTWRLSGSVAAVGQSHHPDHSVDGSRPGFVATELTAVIERQEGPVFYGTMRGPRGSIDRFVGSVTPAGQGVVVNDRGGEYRFTVVNPDRLDSLYSLGTRSYLAAAHTVWERQAK